MTLYHAPNIYQSIATEFVPEKGIFDGLECFCVHILRVLE